MGDEISLKDMIDVLARQRKSVLWSFVLCIILSVVISFTVKPIYESKAQLLIRTSNSGGASMSGLASMMGINLGGPYPAGGSITDLAELVKTPAVERLVRKKLLLKLSSDEIRDLNGTGLGDLKIKINGSILDITVRHKDPVLSAVIVDTYVEELSEYWNKLNITEARKKREYLEKQLPIAEKGLKNAENKLKSMTYLFSSSPALVTGQGVKTVELLGLERELQIQAGIYQMLRTEYANAKVQEAKEVSPFSDIEKAEIPKNPSIPNKKLNIIVGAVLGLFGGVLFAFLKDYFEKEYRKT